MNDESPAVGEVDEHDEWCEAEFIVEAGGYTPCDCANRNELRRRGFRITRAAVSDPDADTTVSYEVRCAHDLLYGNPQSGPEALALAARRSANSPRADCKPWSVVKVTTTTTRAVLS